MPIASVSATSDVRVSPPAVDGKFLRVDGRRFLIRGVTYGTFAPDAHGQQFPAPDRVASDFARMASCGINTVRTYTVPDARLLDEAARHGLHVMAGVPWMQHVAFLENRRTAAKLRAEVVGCVRRLDGHPALLMAALGNEIPPAVVRWHGQAAIERFLGEMFDDVRAAAPGLLLTYVNFPPTEYLELPFIDVCAFNVYLHREHELRRYLARLQHVAGDRPLLMAEAGADSIREGVDGQAGLTSMQLRASFAEGACGAIAFTWTDEWWRGGLEIEDWAFGLVDRDRRPKPALEAVARVFADAPFDNATRASWPTVSVVVCAYNAANTVDECLTSLEALSYPSVEILLVNDGSTDATGDIARRHRCRVLDVPNGGLSAARNVGLAAATGEIVAYTDADVRVDTDWLTYLIQPFLTSDVVGSGGPNIVPPDDPFVAQCVARSPGSPTHVLLDDRIAEHVPGCNMAFRRESLLAAGGFDPVYLRAGDDVDVCWRLQKLGWQIAFAPSAVVWHHHRATVRAYWRQQAGYGEGEQWLKPHHPDRFSGTNVLWRGTIYSPLPAIRSMFRPRVNTGPWGTAPFPSVYQTFNSPLAYAPQSAAWMLATILLLVAAGAALLAGWLAPGGLLGAAGLVGLCMTLFRAAQHAMRTDVSWHQPKPGGSAMLARLRARSLIAWLHFIQPLARAVGRVRALLVPPEALRGRKGSEPQFVTRADFARAVRLLTLRRTQATYWSERWTSGDIVLRQVLAALQSAHATSLVQVDDGWQPGWDIRMRVCPGAWLVVRALVEEHDRGRCLVRVNQQLKINPVAEGAAMMVAAWAMGTAWFGSLPHAMAIVGGFSACAMLLARMASRAVRAAAAGTRAVDALASDETLLRLDRAGQPILQGMPDPHAGTRRVPAGPPHLDPIHGGYKDS